MAPAPPANSSDAAKATKAGSATSAAEAASISGVGSSLCASACARGSANDASFSVPIASCAHHRHRRRARLDAAGYVGDAGEAYVAIVVVAVVNGRLCANCAVLNLEAQDAAIFERQLAANERVRLEDVVVGSARRYHQLHFPAAHVDVDGFVTIGVVVQRLMRITRWFAHKRFLNVASFHAKKQVAQFVPLG